MNPNKQPPKMGNATRGLARQVLPFVRDFFKGQFAAHNDHQVQQHESGPSQPLKQRLIVKVEAAISRFLHRPNRQNEHSEQILQAYQPGCVSGQPYGQEGRIQKRRAGQKYEDDVPQRREVEIQECLRTHNEARRSAPGRSRPDLKWDERLATHAQGWAEHLAREDIFEHDRSGTGEGENLFLIRGTNIGRCTFKHAVEAWNEEVAYYSGQKIGGGDSGKYGHYTQNVWPKTTHVGMARAAERNGAQYIVARYSPPGNVMGRTAYE